MKVRRRKDISKMDLTTVDGILDYLKMGAHEGTAWYGLAPHKHDLSLTGSIVGSTVFDLLPEPPSLEGSYWMDSHKAWFTPDDEDGTMGMWHTD